MFRVLIKLAFAALVVYAVWGTGSTYWRFYQYEDALQELAQFGERRTDRQLCDQAVEAAANFDVPIAADGITVRRGSNPAFNCASGFERAVPAGGTGPAARIFIDASYTDELKLFPGYTRPWNLTASANAFVRP